MYYLLIGLVIFVLTLKKGNYKFQFSQFGFTHMTLFLIVVQSHFVIESILEGLIWYLDRLFRFVLPVCLVVSNDIMAYIFGKLFGRTPLIKLSPKKTWEGFVGGFVGTIILGFFVSGISLHFSRFQSFWPITLISSAR